MLQQTLAQHLVSLNLHNEVDCCELASICGLTRLTSLKLTISEDPDCLTDLAQAGAGMTSLQELQTLDFDSTG